MIFTIIISATAFALYLQTGFLVLWKNSKARTNRWFFLISVYLSFLAVSLTLAYSLIEHEIAFILILRASWSIIPAFLFRFHTLLAGVPRQKNIHNVWFFTYLFMGSLIGLFIISSLLTIEHDRLLAINEWFGIRLIWDYLFYLIVFSNLVAVFYQYYYWRKQIAWRKERREFSYVIYSMIIPGAIYALLEIFRLDLQIATLLKQPHIFLLPWFMLIAFGFTRYNFSLPDPAKAASVVLNDLKQVFLFCNEQLELKQVNAYAHHMLKYKKDDIKKLDIARVIPDQPTINKLFAEANSSGHAGPEETSLIAANGEKIPFSISCTLLKDKFDDVYGLAFYGTDLSEVYALRDEIRRRKEIENSLRNIGDDLESEARKRSFEIRRSLEQTEQKMLARLKAEELIRSEIIEMDVMMGEIHSRNKKNLGIILSILDKTIKENLTSEEKQQMRSLYQRINSILSVNSQILGHDHYGMVRFKNFLETLVESYCETHGRPAGIILKADDELLWVDQAIPLALVANELISNAFRHAFANYSPNDAYIQIKYWHESNKFCKLEVSDNGSGEVPGNPDMSASEYSGFHLVNLLVKEQMNGSIEIIRQNGATLIICIPLDQLRRGHMGHDS